MLFGNNKKISLLSFIITQRCNLKCSYCYLSRKKIDISEKVLKEYSKSFLETPGVNKRVIFVGGEPTLKTELVELGIKYLKYFNKSARKKIQTVINTNGIILNKKVLKLYENLDYISVSMDGKEYSQNLNRKTINGKTTFKKVIQNIETIKKFYPQKLIINKVISSNNYQNLFEDIFFIYSLNPKVILWNIALEDGQWTKEKLNKLSNQIKKLRKWADSKAHNKNFRKIFPRIYQIEKRKCVLDSLTVNTKGELYHCEILSNLQKDCLGNLKQGIFRQDLINCRFSLKEKSCKMELCRHCDQICLNDPNQKNDKKRIIAKKNLQKAQLIISNISNKK